MLKATLLRSAGVAAVLLALGCGQESDPMFNEVAVVEVFSSTGYFVQAGRTLQLEGRAVTWRGDRVDDRVSSWTSSNPEIAIVSNTGLVTGVAVGSTDIVARAQGVNSAPRLINVTAGDPPTGN